MLKSWAPCVTDGLLKMRLRPLGAVTSFDFSWDGLFGGYLTRMGWASALLGVITFTT